LIHPDLFLKERVVKKTTVRTLILSGFGGSIVGAIVFFAGFVGLQVSTTTDAAGSTSVTGASGGNPALFGIGILLLVAAGIVSLIAWIGALIRTAQTQRWGWFVAVLLVSGLGTLIWALAGPDAPAIVAPTGYVPPSGYPPQE
jgi:hypothetical protein